MKSLADKDGQIQAFQERILRMKKETARKDVAITNLSGRVKSLLEQNLQCCTGEFKEAKDEARYLDVCASVIGEQGQLVREWSLEYGTNYVDTLDDVESFSYSNLWKEIEEMEGLFREQLLHFFNLFPDKNQSVFSHYDI